MSSRFDIALGKIAPITDATGFVDIVPESVPCDSWIDWEGRSLIIVLGSMWIFFLAKAVLAIIQIWTRSLQ